MSGVREATLSGAKWGMIEKFSVMGARFIIGLIMARLLSPDDYGQVAVITVFILIGDTLVDSGFGNALIRKKDHNPVDFSTVFYTNLLISLGCYAILFFAAPYVAEFFKMPIVASLLRVQSISLVINALFAVQISKLTIELNFRAMALINFMASLLSGIVGIALAYSGFGVWALVIQTIISSIVTLVGATLVTRWLPGLVFSKRAFKELFSYGSKLLASSLIHRIYSQLTTIIIGRFYTPQDLGTFDRGTGLATMPTDTVGMVMQKVTFPILAKLQDDDARLLEVYRKYLKILSLVIFFCAFLFASLAKPIILIVLSSKWIGAVIFLQIYSFSTCFSHLDSININFLYVKGRSDLVLRLEFIKKTLSILVLLASIPFGVIAICIARVIHMQITVIFDSYYTGKFYGYGYMRQLRDVGKYLVVAIAVSLPGYLLSTYTDLNNWLLIGIGSIIAIGGYYLTFRTDPVMQEVVSLAKSVIRKK